MMETTPTADVATDAVGARVVETDVVETDVADTARVAAQRSEAGRGQGDDETESNAAPRDRRTAATTAEIEEEGDIAADYIEEFLDICDIDGDIDIETRPGRAFVAVNSDEDGNLGLLSKPETVNALQELTRLAVQAKNGHFSRLILDIGGSRDAREQELIVLVERAIARIDAGSADAALPAMTSYERKIVHDLVADRGYQSASEGAGSDRHTVISLRA